MKKPNLIYPFPEVLKESEGWQIIPGGGVTCLSKDPTKRAIGAPLGTSDYARAIRFHELLHIHYSPMGDEEEVKAVKAPQGVVQGVEDFRIHYKALRNGLDIELSNLVDVHDLPGMLKQGTHSGALNFLHVATLCLCTSPLPGLLGPLKQNILEKIIESWESGLDIRAKQLEGIYQVLETALGYVEKIPTEELTFEKVTKVIAEWLTRQSQMMDQKCSTMGSKKTDKEPTDTTPCDWVPMVVKHPVLTRYKFFDSKGISKRPRDTGSFLRYPQRYCVDKSVFQSHRAKKGGTILVDVSASNSISPGEIEGILKAAPSATVAVYFGSAAHKRGEVIIVGHNSQRAKKMKIWDDHNLIDGPALQWLAKQKTPRFWLTDGKVTGLSAQGARIVSQSLREECDRLCKQFRITEVRSLQNILDQI